LKEKHDDRVVTTAEPDLAIGCGEQRFLLGPTKRGDELSLGLLGRDSKNPLARGAARGLLKRYEAKERVDRSEPGVSRSNAVMPLLLEVLEERDHEGGVEVGKR
jgi:hypothetical protein